VDWIGGYLLVIIGIF